MKSILAIVVLISISFCLDAQSKPIPHGNTSHGSRNLEEPLNVAEQMPRFPGCEDQGLSTKKLRDCSNRELITYIFENLTYPDKARKNGTQGKAIVQFTIKRDGHLDDIALVRDPGDGCGEAAEQVILKMQKEVTWIPGQQRGQTVSIRYTLPIDFKL